MLSPGKHHLRVPRGRAANLRFRRYVLKRCRQRPAFRRAVKKMCSEDILFFIDTFVWQFNPNHIGDHSTEMGPWVSWPYQHAAVMTILEKIERRKPLVIEKSREMGASWLCLLVMLWMVLFKKYKKFLCISKDAESVDDADPDSLFWKLDHVYGHLPKWLVPKLRRIKMIFEVPANGSTITGAASTSDAATGGRATAIFVDEFTLIKKDFALYHRTANTSRCRIFNGTHRGTGTCMYDLVDPTSEWADQTDKLQMHWSQHPDKNKGMYHYDLVNQCVVPHDPTYVYPPDYKFVTDGTPTGGPFPGLRSPWYDEIVSTMRSERAVAMDLDINPQGAVEQIFDPLVVKSLVARYAGPPRWEGDAAVGDDGTLTLTARRGGLVRLWLQLDGNGRPPLAPYAFGIDNAQGTGATPTCLSGMNARTGEKVLEWADPHIDPAQAARVVVALCGLFRDREDLGPLLCWEVPGAGYQFGKKVIEMGYRRVYYRRADAKFKKDKSDTPGWVNQPETKAALIAEYKDALKTGKCLNRSKWALEDCLNFKYNQTGSFEHSGEASPNDYSGARVNHGDIVMADAMAWKMVKELSVLAEPGGPAPDEEIDPRSLAFRMKMAQDEAREADTWA